MISLAKFIGTLLRVTWAVLAVLAPMVVLAFCTFVVMEVLGLFVFRDFLPPSLYFVILAGLVILAVLDRFKLLP